MTEKVDNEQQQNGEGEVEEIELFSDGFDDSALTDGGEGNDPEQEAEAPGGNEPEPDDLPEKYRGKSIHDIVDMHQNLEKAYGRHNNELGELRQLTDQILKQQLESKPDAQTENLDPDSFLDNPQEALNKAIEANPRLSALQEKLEARDRAEQKQAFDKVHPDSDKVVNDPRFGAWVSASPTRLALFQKAHTSYDYELASELLSLYKAIEPAGGDEAETTTTARRQMASPAKSASSTNGAPRKQVFRRAELMRLKTEDPDRYEKLQPQILAAYAEGRVK